MSIDPLVAALDHVEPEQMPGMLHGEVRLILVRAIQDRLLENVVGPVIAAPAVASLAGEQGSRAQTPLIMGQNFLRRRARGNPVGDALQICLRADLAFGAYVAPRLVHAADDKFSREHLGVALIGHDPGVGKPVQVQRIPGTGHVDLRPCRCGKKAQYCEEYAAHDHRPGRAAPSGAAYPSRSEDPAAIGSAG